MQTYDSPQTAALPHSEPAEEAVIGAVLKQPEAINLVAWLAVEDFYTPRFRHVFAAMRQLWQDHRPIDYATLCDALTQQGTYDAAGGMATLVDVNTATPTAAHVEHYAGIVRRSATARRTISAAQRIAELAYRDDLAPDDLVAQAGALLQGVRSASPTRRMQSPAEWTSAVDDLLIAREEGHLAGISTGFRDVDAMLLGLTPGDLILLCARMRVGKSQIAQQIAHVAEQAGPVLFVSQEMSGAKLGERALAWRTGISRSYLRRGQFTVDDWHRMRAALDDLAEGNVTVTYGPTTTAEIRADALQVQAQRGKLALVVVDYLQLLNDTAGSGSKRYDDVGAAAKRLKDLAMELDCPVLVPTQLNRDADGLVPTLGDIADSDIPARVADVVLALHRRELTPPVQEADRGLMEVYVLKSRDLSDTATAARLVWRPDYECYGDEYRERWAA